MRTLLVISLAMLTFTVSNRAGQIPKLQSRDDLILKQPTADELKYASRELVSETEDGRIALFSSWVMITEAPPSKEMLKGLVKLEDSSGTGFKELFASELLLESGHELSEHGLERALAMASGKIKDHPFPDEKRLLAIKVLQSYRNLLQKRKAQ
jgi:hypothetical protein